MTYVPGEIGVGLARCEAIQQFIIAAIPDLNTVMSTRPISNIIPQKYGGALQANDSTVVIGDIDAGWPITEGYLKIAVCPGNMRNGLDATFERKYIDSGGGITEQRGTDVYVIFQASVFNTDDTASQRMLRLHAIENVHDWLIYGCLNRPGYSKVNGAYLPIATRGGGQMPLTSRIYQVNTSDPNDQEYDELQLCMVTSSLKGYFSKGNGGGRAYWGIHAIHESKVQP